MYSNKGPVKFDKLVIKIVPEDSSRVAAMLEALRGQPPATGGGAVLVPGDPERQSRERRRREGVPVPEAVLTSNFGTDLAISRMTSIG